MNTITTQPTTTNSDIVEYHVPCDDCGSSDGKCVYGDGHSFCFACNTYTPPSRDEAKFTYEFVPHRGITKETMAFYGVSAKIDEEGKPVELGFKYPNGNAKIRVLGDKKYFYSLPGKKPEGLFGSNKFAAGGHSTVTITEGELDALSLYQVLRSPVVSVQSAASALRDCASARSFLNSFDRIYLAFDNDPAGREATSAVANLFERNKVFHVKFSNRKDANEYLQVGEEKVLKEIWKNSKKYLPENILSSFEEFKQILEEPPKVGVPYPFKALTDMTYGIRLGETVLITAQEKVGKTEVLHHIEHKLLKETDYNVGALYFEEKPRRHLEAIAGVEDKQPYHLPDCPRSHDQVLGTIQKVLGRDDRLFIYSYYGTDDPDVLLDTVRYLVSACGCRVILFDHLTMAVTGNRNDADERRTLDYLSTRLEMMVKELDFALIIVSHVNDEGKTRGSRNPTKVFDTTIGLFRDLQHTDPLERSTVYVRVLFNRFGGKSGPACKLRYDQSTCTFIEEPWDDGHPSSQGIAANDNQPSVFSGQSLDAA